MNSKFKIGDLVDTSTAERIFDRKGIGEIIDINYAFPHPIMVKFPNGSIEIYTSKELRKVGWKQIIEI